MSRTYRFRRGKSRHLTDKSLIYAHFVIGSEFIRWFWCDIDPKSDLGKKYLALSRSDKKKYIMISAGPGHFHAIRESGYRTKIRNEISNFLKNEEYEIQLRRKPHRDYWW